jgi:hypothetical protein
MKGYNDRKWAVPKKWMEVKAVDLYNISDEGLTAIGSIQVENECINLSLKADQAIIIVPKGTLRQDIDKGGESTRVVIS